MMMPNNSNNNTNTDNTSIHLIGSQNDEQKHPGNEEDIGEEEEIDHNSSPTSQNDKIPDPDNELWPFGNSDSDGSN
eukprot:14357847-Ditylum_brightwellii.AAC.1